MNANETKSLTRKTARGTIKPGTMIRWHNGPLTFTERVFGSGGRLVVLGVRSGTVIPLEVLIRNFGGEEAIEIL